MFGVCLLHPELSQEHELDQWIYLCHSYGVDKIFVVGNSFNRKGVTSISHASDLLEDNELVIVQPKEAREIKGHVSLYNYTHPKDVVYVFGPSDGVLRGAHIHGLDEHNSLYIEMPEGGELHAPLAGSIVLYDRWSKLG